MTSKFPEQGGTLQIDSLPSFQFALCSSGLCRYVEARDISEACRCLHELAVPFFHHEFIKSSLMRAVGDSEEGLDIQDGKEGAERNRGSNRGTMAHDALSETAHGTLPRSISRRSLATMGAAEALVALIAHALQTGLVTSNQLQVRAKKA